MESKSKTFTGALEQLDEVLHEYLVKKVPALPANAKEALVNFGPWISLIVGIMLVPLFLTAFGLGALMTPFAMMVGVRLGPGYMLGLVVAGVQLVFQFMAVPGLMKRSMAGWKMLFYGTLVGGVYSLIGFNLPNFLIGTGLGLYLLYQVKSYYK